MHKLGGLTIVIVESKERREKFVMILCYRDMSNVLYDVDFAINYNNLNLQLTEYLICWHHVSWLH